MGFLVASAFQLRFACKDSSTVECNALCSIFFPMCEVRASLSPFVVLSFGRLVCLLHLLSSAFPSSPNFWHASFGV